MHYDPIAEPKDTRTGYRACLGCPPQIGKATERLETLRQLLISLDHPGEAVAVAHILDLLIPSRTCRGRLA